jgi:hypothetical protein
MCGPLLRLLLRHPVIYQNHEHDLDSIGLRLLIGEREKREQEERGGGG